MISSTNESPTPKEGQASNGVAHHATAAPPASEPRPLNVIIVGAGIGGLTLAIALRAQGQKVTIYERSAGDNETGAAIHLAPNANGILRKLGIFPENFGANPMSHFIEYTHEGKQVVKRDLREANKIWQNPWQLVNRVQLHRALCAAAIDPKRDGPPAIIFYSSKVVGVNGEAGEISLSDGTTASADVVLGADGVHSYSRAVLTKNPVKPFPSGKSAYRFLISRKAAHADPRIHEFTELNDALIMWCSPDSKIVMYPCDNNESLNFVCIHPDKKDEATQGAWGDDGSLQQVLNSYKSFDPKVLTLLSMANPSSIMSWRLLDMEKLETFVSGKFAVLGDAAHPFLPYQGQGGGVAIEDAACLSVVLQEGTLPEEVPERLKLYEKIRFERAHQIQEYSRQAGWDPEDGHEKIDMQSYTVYNFCHDEFHNSANSLRRWQWEKHGNLFFRMPLAFGPAIGPRQDYFGRSQGGSESTFITASVKFKTSRTFLQNLFPNKKFSFVSPGTVAYATFSTTTLNKMNWLGGGGYNHLGFYIHGCRYTKENGEQVDGTYLPLLFENLTDPIISGRDEIGMPKVYCAIDIHRRANSWHVQTSWQGAVFGNISLEGLEEVTEVADKGSFGGEGPQGMLIYKYIPKVGVRGQADCEYPVLIGRPAPGAATVASTTDRTLRAKKSSVEWSKLDWNALPTLHHITSTLAEVPIYEIVEAKVVEGRGVSDVSSAQRIE